MTAGDARPDPRSGPLSAARWFLSTDHEGVTFLREMLSSALAVGLVGVLLFSVSGVWPPMVAVQSGSMEPHMHRGDLVFVMDESRFPPSAARADTGVVPFETAREIDSFRSFGSYGDVIIYQPDGSELAVPIIHRARFWVEEGENWYPRANDRYVTATSCEALAHCPAEHAGFITKGDANRYYDQAQGISGPVRPTWIRGTAEVKIPWLGYVRLFFSETLAGSGGDPTSLSGTVGTASAATSEEATRARPVGPALTPG